MLRNGRWWLCALGLTALGAARSQPPDDGASSYVVNGCYQCHGYEGQGGVAGPRIAPTAYPYEAFARLVRRPPNEMPAYAAESLGDETLRAIYRYVRSLPEPPPASDIALLR